MDTPNTIDMTPSDEGYRQIALTFIRALSDDFKATRRTDARFILGSVLDVAFYLARTEAAADHKAALLAELA